MRELKITLPPTATLRPVPAWSRVKNAPASDADAAFAAGAGLVAVDVVVRSEAAFAGVWRQRLALAAAAATVRSLGRREDQTALRDAWCFRASGEHPGPSGQVLRIWRSLSARSTGWSVKTIESAANALGLDLEGRAGEFVGHLDAHHQKAGSPLAAAVAFSEAIVREFPQAELLALMLADLVLATAMRWPKPVPLVTTQIHHPMLRIGEPRRRPRPGERGWPTTLATATALAATAAVDLAIDLERRAGTLQAAASKLRAKGAENIVAALLDDDAQTPALAPGQMSDRALRRLFDRLVELGAVRELSGRPSFRIYGL